MRASLSKTWSMGPLKVTLSKSGANVSIGVPGLRVGMNTKGEGSLRVGKKGLAYTKKKKLM